MKQGGYTQKFQIHQQMSQRTPNFKKHLQNDLPTSFINSPLQQRRQMNSSVIQPSEIHSLSCVALSPMPQRLNSPLVNASFNSQLSNSSLSIQNTSTIPNGNSSIHFQNGITQPPTIAPMSPNHQINNIVSLSKSMQGNFVQQANSLQENMIKHTNQIKDLESQIKVLKDELNASKTLCLATQNHNDELITKIKVLIKENEKIQEIESESEETKINKNETKSTPNIQLILLENKRFQGIIRDLESKTKVCLLIILDFQLFKNYFKKKTIISIQIRNFQFCNIILFCSVNFILLLDNIE